MASLKNEKEAGSQLVALFSKSATNITLYSFNNSEIIPMFTEEECDCKT